MRVEYSVADANGVDYDLIAHADPATSAAELIGYSPGIEAGAKVFRGAGVVEGDANLAAGSILSGDVISNSPRSEVPDRLPVPPLLAVVGGADAGRIHAIHLGAAYQVGRAENQALLVDDPTVSRVHATIEVAKDGSVAVTDLSKNGVFVGGRRVERDTPVIVAPGQRFILGQAVLEVMLETPALGSVEVSHDGERGFNRVTRHRPPAQGPVRVTMPVAPADSSSTASRMQLVTSGVMVLAGVVTAVLFGNLLFAVVGVLAPLAMFSTTIASGRAARKDKRARHESYDRETARARERINEAAAEEQRRADSATFDAARLALAAAGPTTILWSANSLDPDALVMRIGTHDRRARIDLGDDRDPTDAPTLVAVPVTVDLRQSPVVGIAGPPEFAGGIARSVVHQLALLHGPDELAIFHLSSGTGVGWEWLRWLPHVRAVSPEVHSVSPTPGALAERLAELNAVLRLRQDLRAEGYGRTGVILPQIVVVLDNAKNLRSTSSLVTLMKEGRDVGIYVIAVEAEASTLPREATAQILVDADPGKPYLARLLTDGQSEINRVTPDLITATRAIRSARAIASLVPLGGAQDAGLPTSVRLIDIVDTDLGDPASIRQSWLEGEPGSAVIGVDETGNALSVDLVEHGPHALVVGTSGSGKSEFVRTLLTGLALSAKPTDLTLFLIDYKGGGAFGKLRDLPHAIGYADNLSIGGSRAQRLLDSLKEELRVRQQMFKRAGNSDGLSQYQAARARDPQLPPVARLVIAVDEFAQLKQEQPDFIDGLVEVARIGRSLGVHLILATQEPNGVVTEQIRTNVKLRICLRTLDTSTSRSVVGSPIAGTFPNRALGRAAVVAGDQLLVVQTGYVSAPVRDADAAARPAPVVRELAWDRCGISPAKPDRAEQDTTGETDLTRFVNAARLASTGMDIPKSPWLEPLPDLLPLAELADVSRQLGPLSVSFGLEDQPAAQAQPPATFTLGSGNLALAGGPGSGRSTALTTIAAALAQRFSADEVHLHVLDLTASAPLLKLKDLPHCGTVANRRQVDKSVRLLARLRQELERRSDMLARRGLSTFAELVEADGQVLPWLVVLVDGWDSINAAGESGDRLRPSLLKLADDGPPLGLQLVLAGGTGLAHPRIQPFLSQTLVLGFKEPGDLRQFRIPVAANAPTPDLVPGQAKRPGVGNIVQIAVLGDEASAAVQGRGLAAVARASAAATTHRPLLIKDMPLSIGLDEARSRPTEGEGVVVAVGDDDLRAFALDLGRAIRAFVVLGRAGTGRTTALVTIARQLAAAGVAHSIFIGERADSTLFAGLRVGTFSRPPEVKGAQVVLVDDSDLLADSNKFLDEVLLMQNVSVVVAGDPERMATGAGWRETLGATAGIVLSPQRMSDAGALGARLNITGVPAGMPPGRGYLIRAKTDPVLVQIPLPPSSAAAV